MWLIISLLGIITFLFWYLSAPFYWKKQNIPYLTPLPIFGNYLPLIIKGVTGFNESLYKHFPGQPFYGFHFFTRPALFVKDPELIQKILITDFEYFTSHGMYSNQDRDPLGGNLFHIYGQQWKEMRGKMSQYFTPVKVKAMLSYVDRTLSKAIRTIDDSIDDNEPVEMKYILMNITTDVITQAIFGIETDTFQKKDSVFSEVAEEMFKTKLTSRTFLSIISPRLYDYLKLCILDEKSTTTVIDIVKKTVDYRRKEKIYMQDYLQGMMELVDNYTDLGQKYFPDNTRVPGYDLKTLICQAVLLFAAGIETSALAMTFFLYEMATHPEMQEKCREEIKNITKETGQEINVGDLSKLIYLTAALQETLRMHSPLSMINRECTKNYKIPGSNVVIEKGTFIFISAVGTHMDPKYFSEPNVFRPERFMNGSKIKNGTYLPFGIGPRTCLGMSLAYGEMKLVLARFLQRYEFSVCSKTDVPIKPGKYNFLKTPANGMWLDVRQIKCVN